MRRLGLLVLPAILFAQNAGAFPCPPEVSGLTLSENANYGLPKGATGFTGDIANPGNATGGQAYKLGVTHDFAAFADWQSACTPYWTWSAVSVMGQVVAPIQGRKGGLQCRYTLNQISLPAGAQLECTTGYTGWFDLMCAENGCKF